MTPGALPDGARINFCQTEQNGNRDVVRMRWGLVPSWWPKPLKELGAATFNARAETIAENPSSATP
jgi:putative SOS response-associated peptidase YedK